MLKLNSELRAASRTTLSGNWTIAALVTLLYLLIAGGVSSIPKVGTVVSLIITYPLTYGFAILFLGLFREGTPIDIGKLFDGFKVFSRTIRAVIHVIGITHFLSQTMRIPTSRTSRQLVYYHYINSF